MKTLTLEPENKTFMHDSIKITCKRDYVYITAYIDGCGNDFKVDKEKLLGLLE